MSTALNVPTRAARRRAILAILGAALLFAVAGGCVKALGGEVPLAQVVLFRSFFALPVLLLLLREAGGWRVLRTRRPRDHALRTFFGLVGMAATFHGIALLPLATVTALGFTMPLFLAALAVPLLGERVGIRRGSAILAGFVGVLLMVVPGTDAPAGTTLAPSLIVLVGAVAWALAMITIRRMGEAGESGVGITIWFSIGCSVAALLASLPGWLWPTPTQWAFLLAVGAISAVAQLLMTNAYRAAEPTVVAPFEYSGIVWTTAIGALFWAEMPGRWDAIGILILVGSGLYIWHREATLGLRR
jgi:drug/metabolite transporter (DMT)-like permease